MCLHRLTKTLSPPKWITGYKVLFVSDFGSLLSPILFGIKWTLGQKKTCFQEKPIKVLNMQGQVKFHYPSGFHFFRTIRAARSMFGCRGSYKIFKGKFLTHTIGRQEGVVVGVASEAILEKEVK